MSIEWNKVTNFSRFLAFIILFGALPLLTFYIGTQYEEAKAMVASSTAVANPVFVSIPKDTSAVANCADDTQAGLDACAGSDLKKAQAELDADYAVLEKTGANPSQIEKSRKTWTEYVTEECDAANGPQEDGGTIWPMDYTLCETNLTKTHIQDLQTAYTDQHGDKPF